MPHITTDDGVKLWFEESGSGLPVVFVHEFGGDIRSWEPQLRHFARNYRAIAFNARGYPPSDVPEDVSMYGQQRATDDILAILDALDIEKAHIVGLSMGGFAALHFGFHYPDRALSLTVAGAGYGAHPDVHAQFAQETKEVAARIEADTMAEFSKIYAIGPTRVQFANKDPRGWAAFVARLAEHPDIGSALTQRGVQASRPGLWDLEDKIRAIPVPTMIVTGDDDQRCLAPGLFMKDLIDRSRLFVLPNTGHVLNLEEPEIFNTVLDEFLSDVDTGKA